MLLVCTIYSRLSHFRGLDIYTLDQLQKISQVLKIGICTIFLHPYFRKLPKHLQWFFVTVDFTSVGSHYELCMHKSNFNTCV